MRRFNQYKQALAVLSRANEQDLSNEFVQSGIIDKFSLQFELGWKMFKELLRYEGDLAATTGSPRDVLKAAYRTLNFIDEDLWLAMLRERNTISHLYDEQAMQDLLGKVLHDYIPEFERIADEVVVRYGDMLDAID